MSKTTTTYALAGAALVLAGHLSGCTEGLLAGIDRATEPAQTAPTRVVDGAKARQQLAALTVAPEGPGTGYSREHFPHWSPVSGRCDTRETVLAVQGTGVQAAPDCYPDTGAWTSPYDDEVWTDPSDVDIDHMVSLKEAWESGAAGWTERRREEFANDLGPDGDGYPQLIAVTDNVNARKGDRDPAKWRPPLTSYRCTYAAMWIEVKTVYNLTADPAEMSALDDMLDTCGGTP